MQTFCLEFNLFKSKGQNLGKKLVHDQEIRTVLKSLN